MFVFEDLSPVRFTFRCVGEFSGMLEVKAVMTCQLKSPRRQKNGLYFLSGQHNVML